jgi:hypothetical protein
MRRAALALALIGALLVGGCGIPGNTGVRVLGAGPSADPAQKNDTVPPPPVTRTDTKDVQTFINNYLQAAAGDPVEWVKRVTSFMTPAAKKAFKPNTSGVSSGVTVVRPLEDPFVNPDENEVTQKVQQIGVLGDDGELVPFSGTDSAPISLSFQVVRQKDETLYLAKAPVFLYLSDKGLATYYQEHTIYFWNHDNTGLVPDVRYMPLNVPTVQRPTVILGWLSTGPAGWLGNAVHGWPSGTTVSGNIPAISDDRLQISLTSQAVSPGDNGALDRLRRQLLWSLSSLPPNTVLELKVGHQNTVSFPISQYQDSNAFAALLDDPSMYVVDNGVIHKIADTPHEVNEVPLLKPAANRGIQSAAFSASTQHTFAAVVTGSGASTALRVAVAPTGQEADLQAVPGLRAPLGYPAWAITATGDAATAVGLILSKNRLFSFSPDHKAAQPVEWSGNDIGPVTAFSVAPDGYRVVLIAGGKLYRAVLTPGTGSDGVALSTPQQLVPFGLASVSAASWSSEGWLVVSGVRTDSPRVALYDVSIDDAKSSARPFDIGNVPVTYLTSYPVNPVAQTRFSDAEVAYVYRGAAWSAPNYPSKILPSELAGPVSTPAGSTAVITAPFFLN